MFSPVFRAVIKFQEASREEKAHLPAMPTAGRTEQRRKAVVILFADLRGSVEFFQEKGTVVAHNWIVKLYRMLSSIIGRHGGMHIKNIGDAILAVFDDPREAAKDAVVMQADIKIHNGTANETKQYCLGIGKK